MSKIAMEDGVMERAGADQIRFVPLNKIVPTKDNPRRVNTRSAKFLEMIESVRANGVIQPGLGRPHPDYPETSGMIDLRCGERRYRASVEAGRETMPVIVFAMDDRTAIKLTVVENKGREDLSPVESARGIGAMYEAGYDTATIAAELGEKPEFIVRRAHLAKLSPVWVEAYETEGSPYSSWKAGHLELIARFDEETQLRIKGELDKFAFRIGSKTVKELDADLSDFLMVLKKAPWDLESPDLVKKAGSCAGCPKRTDCVPGLFDSFEDKSAAARCMDLVCWRKKEKAWLARKETILRAEHPELVTLTTEYSKKGVDFSASNSDLAKKGQRGAVPALVVDGKDKGDLVYIRPKRDAAPDVPRGPTVGQLRERLAWDRRRFVAQALEEEIGKLKGPPKGLATAERMLQAVLAIALLDDRKAAKVFAVKGKALVALAFKAIQEAVTSNNFDACEPTVLVQLAGVDLKAVQAEAAKALPEPEGWKGLKESDVAPVETTKDTEHTKAE